MGALGFGAYIDQTREKRVCLLWALENGLTLLLDFFGPRRGIKRFFFLLCSYGGSHDTLIKPKIFVIEKMTDNSFRFLKALVIGM